MQQNDREDLADRDDQILRQRSCSRRRRARCQVCQYPKRPTASRETLRDANNLQVIREINVDLKIIALAVVVLSAMQAPAAQAALVGQWTFEGSNPLTDTQGNFPDLVLQGDAQISNGYLNVNGAGTTATGWAQTVGTYTGPDIHSKTLVSWLILQDLNAYAGSAITINTQNPDTFDAIVFGEGQPERWMAGSNNFERYQPFVPGFQETSTGSLLQLAISYESQPGAPGTLISGYRNGALIGSYYVLGNTQSYYTNNTMALFGRRHTGAGNGALDALIQEARIYDTALSQAEIQALQPLLPTQASVPSPLPLLGAMSALGISRRLRKRIGATRLSARR